MRASPGSMRHKVPPDLPVVHGLGLPEIGRWDLRADCAVGEAFALIPLRYFRGRFRSLVPQGISLGSELSEVRRNVWLWMLLLER